MDDGQLLDEYRRDGSQAAFTALVGSHVDLVYSAARRQVADPGLAEDVTQAVFVLLAKRAGKIRRPGALGGWLIKVTRYAAWEAMKERGRRQYHEQQAAAMRDERVETGAEPAWETYAPVVDEAMSRLGEVDRSAVTLRYLQGLSLRQVGQAMGLSEEAARKRVDRGIAKLRGLVAKKVAAPSVVALAAALAANGVQAAPAGLAQAAVAASVGGGAVGTAGAIAEGAMRMMLWAKIKAASVTLAAVLLVAGVMAGVAVTGMGPGPVPAARAVQMPAVDEAKIDGDMALYCYSVGAEASVMEELQAILQPMTSQSRGYSMFTGDAEEVRKCLGRGLGAGRVWTLNTDPAIGRLPTIQPLMGSRFFAYTTVGQRDHDMRAQSDGATAWLLSRAGEEVTFRSRIPNVRVKASEHGSGSGAVSKTAELNFEAALKPGQAMAAILDMGQVGSVARSHVVVWQVLKSTQQQAEYFENAGDSENWLRSGPEACRFLAAYSEKWREAGTWRIPAARDRWQRTLSDGTTVRLITIGRPAKWPFIAWDGDGLPVANDVGWSPLSENQGEATALEIELETPSDPGLDDRPTPSQVFVPGHSSDGRQVWRDRNRRTNISDGLQRTQYVCMGVGPWKSAGRVEVGQTVQFGNSSVRIADILKGTGIEVRYAAVYDAQTVFTFVIVDKRGQIVRPNYCDNAWWMGSSLRKGDGQHTSQACFVEVKADDMDHVELWWRPAETVTFEGYALDPVVKPPFDLLKKAAIAVDYDAVRKLQVTLPDETGPADDRPAAHMLRMLEAARAGNAAEVAMYIAASEGLRGAVAEAMILSQRVPVQFERQFGQAMSGMLAEYSKEVRESLMQPHITVWPDGTATGDEVWFVRGPDNRWQLNIVRVMRAPEPQEAERQAAKIQGMIDIAKKIADDLEAKRFGSAKEAQAAFDAAVQQIQAVK